MVNINRLYRSFRVSFRAVVVSPNFYIAVFLLFCVLTIEDIEAVFTSVARGQSSSNFGDAYFFNISLHFGYYIYATPLLCAFASSGMFVNDYEAGFFRLRMIASGKKEYKCGLFLGTTVGGGCALFVGVVLYAIFCSIIYPPLFPATDITVFEEWLPVLAGQFGNWKYMITHAVLACIFGMVWSGVGLVVSVYSPNRYLSYLTPFIICFCAVLALPATIRPLEMLVQMSWESFTFIKLISYQVTLYIAILTWFMFAFERRVICGMD